MAIRPAVEPPDTDPIARTEHLLHLACQGKGDDDGALFTVERVTRIELALSAWEADVLPLNYTR